jgi:hypothetical protein
MRQEAEYGIIFLICEVRFMIHLRVEATVIVKTLGRDFRTPEIFKSRSSILVFLTQPYNDPLSTFVDAGHETNLGLSLLFVGLVDA